MTPAIKLLNQLELSFNIHEYQHDSNSVSYGEEASKELGVKQDQVFKTLIVELNTKKLVVGVVPVSARLNLKSLAKACGAKKAQMAEQKKVEATTGYVLGGISPLAQKRPLTTVIDSSATLFDTIYISGGRRGLEIELKAQDLGSVLNATFSNILS